MSAKATKPTSGFRYSREELEQRDPAADEKFADDFIARNRDAINADLKAARESIKAGKGKVYTSPDALTADVMKRLRR